MPRPFLLVGAAPGQTTGTCRIATAWAAALWDARARLDIDLLHVGWVPDVLPITGWPTKTAYPWPVWAYQEGTGSFGMRAAQVAAITRWGGQNDGVVLAVEDPGRAFTLLPPAHELQSGRAWSRWGYFTLDGENRNGRMGGPAEEAIQRFDRVLAHTRYGAGLLAATCGVSCDGGYIPHPVDLDVFRPEMTVEERAVATQRLDPTGTGKAIIGCVCTNEARKDLALVVETLAMLKDRGRHLRGWIHIDREVGDAWSLPQLTADAQITWNDLTVTTGGLTDRELATLYASCVVTIAPGRGESFGYPIVESLACGTPCVHVDYAGGACHLPLGWRVPAAVYHTVGPYGIQRPIVLAASMADTIEALFDDYRNARALARTIAQPYDARTITPQLVAWVEMGLGGNYA